MGEVTNLASGEVDLEGWQMEWMRNNESPPWAYLLGALLIISGVFINLLIKTVLLGTITVLCGTWLHRWWYEVPVGHPRFGKMSERRFRFCRITAIVASWIILVLTVAVVCLSVFGMLP